jgi:hypothetical protein
MQRKLLLGDVLLVASVPDLAAELKAREGCRLYGSDDYGPWIEGISVLSRKTRWDPSARRCWSGTSRRSGCPARW